MSAMPPGMDNAAWGIYQGANKKRGAPLTFFVQPQPGDSTAKGLDSATVKIYNNKNELIRTFLVKAESGLNIRHWTFEQDGFRIANSTRGRGMTTPPGWPVIAGEYTVVYQLGNNMDSATVRVKDDPASGDKTAEKLAKSAMMQKIRTVNDALAKALDQLNEADEVVKKIDAQLKDLRGKSIDSLRNATRSIKGTIKSLRENIIGKPKEKQGYYGGFAADVTPLSQLNLAYRYTLGRATAPGEQEEKLLQLARQMADESLKSVNDFFGHAWKGYRSLAENTKINLFKDYKEISAN